MKSIAPEKFSQLLLKWFDHHGRHDLPWQENKTPYRVWVSEIMLQQTQVSTVIPYYQKFMASFPTLEALAHAPLDDVLAHWSGLGYYARARNLHKAAGECLENHAGELPTTQENLISLPGIGRSTAAAIISISTNQRATILDGNVKRVLCRYLGIHGWPGKSQVEKKLWDEAEKLTPETRNSDYTQAIMDLGATLCTRSRPACNNCPFHNGCYAFKHDAQASLPEKKPKKVLPCKSVWMLLFSDNKANILFKKRPSSGIWGGLWSLPEIDNNGELPTQEEITAMLPSGITPEIIDPEIFSIAAQDTFRHTFSHYHLDITPLVININEEINVISENTSRWMSHADAIASGLPAPVKKIIQSSNAQGWLFN